MQHKFSQQQKIFQKMVLTPQMRQSLKLLSMSINDLNEYIDAVITGNPFIQKLIDMKTRGRYEMGPAAGGNSAHASEERAPHAESARDPRANLLSQLKMSGVAGKSLEIAEYLIYEIDENGYMKTDLEEIARDMTVSPEDVQEEIG